MKKIKKYLSPSGSLPVLQISVGENLQGGKMNTLLFLQKGKPITINRTLPNVVVVPLRLYLDTYYPVVSEFPFTGHSAIDAYSKKNLEYDEVNDKVYYKSDYATIDKMTKDAGYNLVTNNCSDATRCALEAISGKKMNPNLFTTPGDVLDFFKENFDVVKDKRKSKFGNPVYYTTISGADFEKVKKLQEQQLSLNRQRDLEKNKIKKLLLALNMQQRIRNNKKYKEGSKISTLLFLKNGSGIHIKKKNRGKFTDYCGGKVTDECIRRAKASGNPTLVKRATFAANARKWKHKNGGKAFIEGVNVLDSNPKAYKYVKKKYKMRMALNGTKVDWNSVANVGVNLLLSVIKNKQISEGAKAAKAANKLTSRDFFNIYNLRLQEAKLLEELLARTTPGTTINPSNIVAAANAWKNASGDYAALKNNVDRQNKIIDAQAQALKSDVWGNAISNVMLQGMGMLNNYLSNKSSNTTTPNISFNKKIDFGNIKTNFGLLGTYSTNSGYLPKQLSFDWSKVGIQ